ncbi:hypothetical protein [Ideonella sp. BN130291]|uniref:hypothetical protein n=1 Tax=Ideonella sp. BN130291 TaxID=3112940 RepID=UPI002E254F5D|nr:hypothetical protein [Ideonella sp. BN130291]
MAGVAAGLQPTATPWRPRTRVGWGFAASALAHGLLLAWLGTPSQRPGSSPVRPAAARPHITWLALAPAAAPAPAPATSARTDTPPPRAPRPAAARKQAAAPTAAPSPKALAQAAVAALPAPEPAASAPQAIAGVAFAPAAIGWGGRAPRPWAAMPSIQPLPPSASTAPPPEAALARMQDAARAQIALALQQQLGRLPAPSTGVQGRCAPPASGAGDLACDSDALQQAVSAQAAALAGLLRAYRGADPRVTDVALAYTDGRYQLQLR